LAKRILVPIDGSELMERNISCACEVAKHTGSKVTLIHVMTFPYKVEPWVPTDRRPFEEAGSKIIEKAKQIAKSKEVESETRLERTFGNGAQVILKAAEEGKFDLIVIGAKRHLLANLMVGSVCDTVVRNAPCPVLVVR
jgi:nucleotide-binding universal stress UspA family protein